MKYTKKRSTPKMGVSNKMYKYSTPQMGKGGGNTLPIFAAIGSTGQSVINKDKDYVKSNAAKNIPEGAIATGKGTFRYVDKDIEKRVISNARAQTNSLNSIFNPNYNGDALERSRNLSIPMMGKCKVSVPAMGPLGAAAGGYAGTKIGSFIGSAGKLIGKKHEKYGRLAGEYIGGSLGASLGALATPF